MSEPSDREQGCGLVAGCSVGVVLLAIAIYWAVVALRRLL